MIYVDTSALLKLVKEEPEGPALRTYLTDTPSRQFVSSALIRVEARRGILRSAPRAMPKVDLLLGDVIQIEISDIVLESAGRLPDSSLRTLDAIHLATALLIREDVDALLTYDLRLAEAARAHGLATAVPS